MKLPTLFAGIAAVLVFAQQPAPWRPPAGIPAPSFGILQTAPAATVYVDATRGRDTNPGTASRPRQTIPLVLPRCTVVQIVGTYPIAHEGPRTIEAQGTADCPVFIRGGTHTSTWEISGTYLILEQASRGFLVVRATTDGRDTHDVAIRDVEFRGAGLGIQATFAPRGSVYNVVALRLNIHDLGDMNTTTDQDVVGVGIYRERNHHIWFLDSTCERVSSDCFQANAQGDPAGVHHVYAGRISCRNNRQGCLWAKQSEDVVFSESYCRQMRPDKGGLNPGQCFGAQYDARRLVILKNQMTDSENGIVLGSFDYGTPKGGVLIAGNLITNIHHTTSADALANPWSGGAAIRLSGGVTALLVNNTIWDVDGGVQIPAGGATTTVVNTVVGLVKRAAFQVEQPGRLKLVTHTRFDAMPRLWIAGASIVPTSADLARDANSIIGSPGFRNVAGGDFRLAERSPLLGAGVPIDEIEAGYRAIHGVPLGLELGRTPDIGSGLLLTEPRPPPRPAPAPTPTPTPASRPCNQFFLQLFGWRVPEGCQ
jgi:hypothetical protein